MKINFSFNLFVNICIYIKKSYIAHNSIQYFDMLINELIVFKGF